MRRRGDVIALRGVASIGNDEVLDGVVGPARPSEEVVHLHLLAQPISAVEAGAVLEIGEVSNERPWEGGAFPTEEMRAELFVLGRYPRPPGDIPNPVQFDERPQYRAEHHEAIHHAVQQSELVAALSPQRRRSGAFGPVDLVQERDGGRADYLEQWDRIPDEGVFHGVQRIRVLAWRDPCGVGGAPPSASLGGQPQTLHRSQNGR